MQQFRQFFYQQSMCISMDFFCKALLRIIYSIGCYIILRLFLLMTTAQFSWDANVSVILYFWASYVGVIQVILSDILYEFCVLSCSSLVQSAAMSAYMVSQFIPFVHRSMQGFTCWPNSGYSTSIIAGVMDSYFMQSCKTLPVFILCMVLLSTTSSVVAHASVITLKRLLVGVQPNSEPPAHSAINIGFRSLNVSSAVDKSALAHFIIADHFWIFYCYQRAGWHLTLCLWSRQILHHLGSLFYMFTVRQHLVDQRTVVDW